MNIQILSNPHARQKQNEKKALDKMKKKEKLEWNELQAQAQQMDNDGSSLFSNDEFQAFKGLLDCGHDHIHMKWVANLNDSSEQLAFIVSGDKLWAMHNDQV